jgi:putative ABC transport system substrate-binding protein
VLTGGTENDHLSQANIVALREGLAKLGWVEGRNLRIDLRFGGDDADRIHTYAAELVGLSPDVIVTGTTPTTRAVLQQTRTIPIVITAVGDPLANGIVKSLARPEGNVTGTTNFFYETGSKWLDLLKQVAPRVERVAIIYSSQISSIDQYAPSIEQAARLLAVKAIKMPYLDAIDIVRAIDAFAAEPNGGLIVVPTTPTAANRALINRLAMQHRLPTIYPYGEGVAEGGLIAYGSNNVDRFRSASSFVDRILRGSKVNELPIEFPTKFELVINLKTAKALGLTIPETLLATADEVIQ